MREFISINEKNISELDMYVGNKEVHLLRYYEPEPGIFIAESKNVIERALSCGYQPISAVMLETKKTEDELPDEIGDIPVYIGKEKILQKYLGYKLPGGVLCAMRRKASADYREVIRDAKRIAVLENVVNPTNAGAVFRSAAALGIDAVLLSPACVDPLYRRAVRVSVGNVFLIPWAYVCQSESTWREQGINMLKEEGFSTVAMALRKDNITIDDPRLKKEEKLAVILGNEGEGLSKSTIDACDYVAKIPMQNDVDSLNVSVAASIAFWELGRR